MVIFTLDLLPTSSQSILCSPTTRPSFSHPFSPSSFPVQSICAHGSPCLGNGLLSSWPTSSSSCRRSRTTHLFLSETFPDKSNRSNKSYDYTPSLSSINVSFVLTCSQESLPISLEVSWGWQGSDHQHLPWVSQSFWHTADIA